MCFGLSHRALVWLFRIFRLHLTKYCFWYYLHLGIHRLCLGQNFVCYEDFFLFAQKFLVAGGRSLLTIFISGYFLVLQVVQYCRCSVSLKANSYCSWTASLARMFFVLDNVVCCIATYVERVVNVFRTTLLSPCWPVTGVKMMAALCSFTVYYILR